MFVPFSVLAGLAVGAAIAWVATGALRHAQDPLRGVYAQAAGWFGLLVWMPATLGVYLLAPDWSLMFLANPVHLPAALMLPTLGLASGGAPLVGFALSYRLAQEPGRLSQWYGGLGLAVVLLIVFGMRRIATGGTYETVHYRTGGGGWLTDTPTFWPILIITLVALVTAGLTLSLVRDRVRQETEIFHTPSTDPGRPPPASTA